MTIRHNKLSLLCILCYALLGAENSVAFRVAQLATRHFKTPSIQLHTGNPISNVVEDNEQDRKQQETEGCPRGYFYDSVNNSCRELGPLGKMSQIVETVGPFQKFYRSISNLFGVDSKKISSLGVGFALSYSIISHLNGTISLSIAWYMASKRTGLSPLVPGQWKSLLACYGALYAIIQVLRPFRVAAAIAMSKLSGEFIELIQSRLNCSRAVAIGCQYSLGLLATFICATTGVLLASKFSGVPIV